MKFKGIFTALLTPFDKNGDINEQELRRLVRFNLSMGARGFYVCGSTAEAFLLTTDERRRIAEIVKDEAPEATLIAHIGSIDERQALILGHHAASLGYDAISSVAPFYYKFSFDEIKNYYFRLAESVGLPMFGRKYGTWRDQPIPFRRSFCGNQIYLGRFLHYGGCSQRVSG